MTHRLNSRKKRIYNQTYEEYWKVTLGLTDFFGEQFIRTLTIIIDHIDKYNLSDYENSQLIKNLDSKKKQFNQDIVHNKELEDKIIEIFPNDTKDGASTRKQINTFIKLGFIRPYLKGYPLGSKEYIDPRTSEKDRRRIFSDIVYEYSSFNSSQTNDDSGVNQIKFLIQTLINSDSKKVSSDELLGIMLSKVSSKKHMSKYQIKSSEKWAQYMNFEERKYNQKGHLKAILSNMDLFYVNSEDGGKFSVYIGDPEHVNSLLPQKGDSKRDKYRYALMRKSVLDESKKIYGKEVSWFSKEESKGLVVSHIYASADALKNWDTDLAYDPNNSLLLKPGDEDQFFDKYDMTFAKDGLPIFSDNVRRSFMTNSVKNKYKLDKEILNESRVYYLTRYHNEKYNMRHG